MGKEQWRLIIEEALKNDYFNITFWPVRDTKAAKITQKVLTFSIYDMSEKTYSYGSFISQAITLGRIADMYLFALKKLFQNPPHSHTREYSIRLSSEFLRSSSTYSQIKQLLDTYARKISFSLIFEISDSIVLNNLELVHHFGALFESYGYKIGINQFTGASKDFSYLKEIRPHFIKADVAFLLDQTAESMSALQLMTDSVGIELIATGVRNQEELDRLFKINITTIQGVLAETLSENRQ
jgi:EAL domain-containing protein (putative c-di-GMP-specific phosphodiesterase class I)